MLNFVELPDRVTRIVRDLILELRRRGVFRAAGIYVAAAWILIEGASVILPKFDVPDEVMRWLVITAFVGFPIAMVLAWIFDLTEQGIQRTDDADGARAVSGVQKGDFIAICALSLALILSVYLNIRSTPTSTILHESKSILVADFDNRTGNSQFDRVLQHALAIDIEGATFITSYDRNAALSLRDESHSDDALTADGALSIATRQGVDFVLSGTLESKGAGYRIGVAVIDSASGETVAEVSGVSKTEADVFEIVAELSTEIRENFNDNSIELNDTTGMRYFTAATLEAAKFYIDALDLAAGGEHEKAVQLYQRATETDADLGRAYAAAALSTYRLGELAGAQKLWLVALNHVETMTERERYRALGQYHLTVTHDYRLAVDNLTILVAKYPADAAGHEYLAAAAFESLKFEKAADEIESALAVYPNNELYRARHARYSMFAGKFDIAEDIARGIVEASPDNSAAYLPLAAAAMVSDDFDAARHVYRQMAETAGSNGDKSVATLGLSDVEIYAGAFDAAEKMLLDGIATDLGNGSRDAASTKYLALAEMQLATGDAGGAEISADNALELSSNNALSVAVAIVFLHTGNHKKADIISSRLQQQSQSQWRAYSLMLNAMILRNDGDNRKSINAMRDALKLVDLWLIRFQLAQTYLRTEQFAEALDELTIAEQRRGEATAVFFDDKPTYRYLATLPYWIGRAQDGLNMRSAASDNYQSFLARWSAPGPLMDDSRRRLQQEER